MSKSFRATSWPGGIDNLTPPDRVPQGFVRAAVNVDTTPGGQLHLRTGYASLYAGTAVRGVLALGHKLLVADDTDLVEVDTRTTASRVLRSIAGSGQFIGDTLNDRLYFQTANETLIYDGTDVREWGVPDVLAQPLPSVGTGGALLAGQYKLAVTFSNAEGSEGGTDAPLILTLSAGASLTVNLPAPPSGGTVNLYVSTSNGQTLYLQDTRAAAGSVTLTALRDDTRILTTAYLRRPPLGSVVRTHDAQLAIAAGNVVWTTAPFHPHLVDMRRGYFQYATEVNALLSDGDLFVSADKCYAINSVVADDPGQRTLLEFPAIRGTEVSLPDGRKAWMTRYGQAITAKDTRGTSRLELVNREHYAPADADRGAAVVNDHNGHQTIITTTRMPHGPNPLAARDVFTGEVLRP